MGIFSEVKKLIFGAESLGKSAINKGKDFAKETGEDLWEKAGTLGEDVAEKTSGLRDAILHQAEGTINMVTKSETLKNVAESTERIGEKILSKGEELINKGTDQVEKLGQTILGENNENLEKAKEFTASVGSKVIETKDKLVHKAEELIDDINEKIDETLAKSKVEEAAEAAKPKMDLKEMLDKNDGSLLKDKDSFFSKAEKFAKGDYNGVLEGQITVKDATIKDKEPSKAAGFTDLDGDGNEVIDDAIIDTEETPEIV